MQMWGMTLNYKFSSHNYILFKISASGYIGFILKIVLNFSLDNLIRYIIEKKKKSYMHLLWKGKLYWKFLQQITAKASACLIIRYKRPQPRQWLPQAPSHQVYFLFSFRACRAIIHMERNSGCTAAYFRSIVWNIVSFAFKFSSVYFK